MTVVNRCLELVLRCRVLAAARTRSCSPMNLIFSGSRSIACRQPSRIEPGAWSPPMPSTATQSLSRSSMVSMLPPCSRRRGSNTRGCRTLLATVPAPDTIVPATLPAALAELVALSTRVVTAALRRYQITRRRMARGRLLLLRDQSAGELSGPFGGNGVDDALEQITGAAGCEDQLGVGRIVFQFGAKT